MRSSRRVLSLLLALLLIGVPSWAATVSHCSTTNDATDANTYTTASCTPGAGDLFVVVVAATDTTVGACSLSNSQGVTFTLAVSTTKNASADMLAAWVANSTASAVSQTVTLDCTSDQPTGSSITWWRIVGMSRTGSSAVRQVGSLPNQAAFSSTVTSFGVAGLTANAILGAISNASNPTGMGQPTGWTETNNSGYSPPGTGKEVAFVNSGFTSTTVAWNNSSTTAFGTIIIELDTSAAATGGSGLLRLGVGK